MKPTLTTDELEALRRIDTCTLSNAIERFDVRLRNEGFADARVRCFFPRLGSMVGHAATFRIKCSSPPSQGHVYVNHNDWWNYLLSIPAPRVVVVQDLDERTGRGSFLGATHANILAALDCVGGVTNGAVRDLPAVEELGFHLFAGSVAVSHAYSHIVSLGGGVEVGGLRVEPGDLLHGDRHGVLSVPLDFATQLPAIAAEIVERERRLIDVCRSGGFTLEMLRAALEDMDRVDGQPTGS
jgi:4-hydroxy-4-methyl-2-oxoglutarate aldolase